MMHSRHHFWAGCGPAGGERWEGGWQWDTTGAFGVRRPLRFLAMRLGLDERQAREVARILDDVKTERAQTAVDHRRMSGALADVLARDAFDAAAAAEAATARLHGAERMRQATVRALERLHAVLRPDQRDSLAMLIRTGAVRIG
jgi:hypothetical protein